MSDHKHITLCLLLCFSFACFSQEQADVMIVSYNVENFFDSKHDSLKNDTEFLPDGRYHWTYTKMNHKAEQIAKVIAAIGGWKTPAIIGLCEIENAGCIQHLCRKLRNFCPYKYVHFEGPDERGVDVAFLYDSTQFLMQESYPIHVSLKDDYTRDILYMKGISNRDDTLHLFMGHLPSMTGGATASEWKRQTAKDIVRSKSDSIFAKSPEAKIIFMGDMNCSPKEDIPGLHNLMLRMAKKGLGTEKYQGHWSCLDQFYISKSLLDTSEARIFDAQWLQERDEKHLGLQPKRTFKGWKYQKEGFSDHLPIVLEIKSGNSLE